VLRFSSRQESTTLYAGETWKLIWLQLITVMRASDTASASRAAAAAAAAASDADADADDAAGTNGPASMNEGVGSGLAAAAAVSSASQPRAIDGPIALQRRLVVLRWMFGNGSLRVSVTSSSVFAAVVKVRKKQ
jgi:hypothetical protein